MKKKHKILKYWPYYVMAFPCVAYLFINNYMPLVGLQLAFKDYRAVDGIWGSKFIGLKNFSYLFKSSEAWVITRNTIGYNVLWIILNAILGIIVAICLNEVKSKTSKKIYQTCILLPYLISMVVVSYLAYAFLGEQTGLINSLLGKLGHESINWYRESKYWPLILTIVNEWKSIGFQAIVYLASISTFSRDYYESAEIDGASRIQQIFKITIPMLAPTIVMLITVATGRIFNSDFGLFYQVPRNQGTLYATTNTIDTFVYRALLQTGDIGMSSAAAFYQSIVSFITIIGFNAVMRRLNRENALF